MPVGNGNPPSSSVLFQVLLHLESRHAAGAGCGDRLAIAPVLHVAAGKDAQALG